MTVAVLGLDTAIAPVDDQFGSLILRDCPCNLRGLGFGIENARSPFRTLTYHRPAAVAGYHVLIAFAHVLSRSMKSRPKCRSLLLRSKLESRTFRQNQAAHALACLTRTVLAPDNFDMSDSALFAAYLA